MSIHGIRNFQAAGKKKVEKHDSNKTQAAIKQQNAQDVSYAKSIFEGVKQGDKESINAAKTITLRSDGDKQATSIFAQAKNLVKQNEAQKNNRLDPNASIFS